LGNRAENAAPEGKPEFQRATFSERRARTPKKGVRVGGEDTDRR